MTRCNVRGRVSAGSGWGGSGRTCRCCARSWPTTTSSATTSIPDGSSPTSFGGWPRREHDSDTKEETVAHIELLDQTLRDGPQSLWGMKMQAGMALPAAPHLDKTGFRAVDLVGSSMF